MNDEVKTIRSHFILSSFCLSLRARYILDGENFREARNRIT
jgi:hypothetical protein